MNKLIKKVAQTQRTGLTVLSSWNTDRNTCKPTPQPFLAFLAYQVHFSSDPMKKGTLSLPRVINFKFPLQPHKKYNITQCQELTQMKRWSYHQFPLPHLYIFFKRLWECTFWTDTGRMIWTENQRCKISIEAHNHKKQRSDHQTVNFMTSYSVLRCLQKIAAMV